MARPPALRARSPARFLRDGLEVAGRTGPGGFAALAALVGGLWALHHLGPAVLGGWGRGAEALVAIPLSLLLVPALGHALRRLNDLGWSGGWAWAFAVPWLRWPFAALLALLPSSQRRRRGHPGLRALGLGTAGAAAIALAGSLVWTAAGVAGQDMAPALRPGDLVLLRRSPGEVARGDVLAFRLEGEAAARFGRVVALAGERVAVEGGAPVIGGRRASWREDGLYVETFARQGPRGVMPLCGNGAVGLGAQCRTPRLVETLPGGRAYRVLDAGARPLDRMEEVVVPEGTVFMLGDHRDAAQDSRLPVVVGGTGFVALGDVVGRASLVVASASGRHPWDPRGWRLGRMLRAVE
jgi:signal peptidase I